MHARGLRKLAMVMAASAAMIVLAGGTGIARAQDAVPDAAPTNGTALVNRIQNLESQMQQMQGEIEVLQHQLQQMQAAEKDQYTDLDARLGKLEQGKPAPAASTATADASAPAAAASAVVAAPAPAAESPAAKAAAEKAYNTAFAALRARNYVDSARGFRAFIDAYPRSALLPNAWYWLGGSYYATGNYKIAQAAFQKLVDGFPRSPKAPDARLKIGFCQFELKEYAAARASLQAVEKAYPGTSVARLAKHRLADIPAGAGAR